MCQSIFRPKWDIPEVVTQSDGNQVNIPKKESKTNQNNTRSSLNRPNVLSSIFRNRKPKTNTSTSYIPERPPQNTELSRIKLDNLTLDESKIRIEKTKKAIWEQEYKAFLIIFNLDVNDLVNVVSEIRKFQKSENLYPDWVIWKTTLKNLYLKKYFIDWIWNSELVEFKNYVNNNWFNKAYRDKLSWNLNSPLQLVKFRYLMYKRLYSEYNWWNSEVVWKTTFRWYNPDNVFNSKKFIWDISTREEYIKWDWNSLIDTRIVWNIPSVSSSSEEISIKKDSNGRNVLLYYKNYKLRFACFTTTWKVRSGDWPWMKSPSYSTTSSVRSYWHRYYDWWSRWPKLTWWPMPSAVWTSVNGIYLHIWDVPDSSGSHWCFRLPALYANILFYEVWSWVPIKFSENSYL